MQTTETGAPNMAVHITRRPTLVDGLVQVGRWWWRNWKLYMAAGGGVWAGAGTTEFTAQAAAYEPADEYEEAEEYRATDEEASAAVDDDARFRNLTGRSFLNFGFSASGRGTTIDTRLLDPAASNTDRKTRSTGGVRRVPPASLILGKPRR